MTTEPACKGKPLMSDHAMILLGTCSHEVGNATYEYKEFACADCGATSRKPGIFACGTGRKRVEPTAENCLALAWKAERKAQR